MLLEAGADSNVVDKEGNTLLHMIGRRVQPASGMFSMGDEIQARRHGLKTWFFGTIGAINEDGTYKINYNDGGVELKVEAELIRVAGGADPKPNATSKVKLIHLQVQSQAPDITLSPTTHSPHAAPPRP